ncbi:MAG: hypothetical protein IJS15_12500 [Victivallales bacterium]|nr:hypothetical protein [Victivallales bacterium]
MSLTELEKWELRLSAVLNRVDTKLEERYGAEFPRRANRPPPGATSNPKYDGLFGIGSAFSLGYASGDGPNYVISIRLSTFAAVPPEKWAEILQFALEQMQLELDSEFLPQKLTAAIDGDIIRVMGDLNFNNSDK